MKPYKKTGIVLLCAALILSAAACGENTQSDNTVSAVSPSDIVSESETAAADTASPKSHSDYQIIPKTYADSDGSIQFTYPQITGLDSQAIQDFYNALFKADCNKAVTLENLETFSGTYEVTLQNAEQLSIVFRCSGSITGGIYPTAYAYAYTIDLKTGETVIPSRSIDIADMAEKFRSQKWFSISGAEDIAKQINEYYTPLDADTVKELFWEQGVISVKKNASGEYVTQGTEYCRSYFNKDARPVIIVPVSHAMGDYAEITF